MDFLNPTSVELSRSESRVAQFLGAHPRQVVDGSLANIAAQIGVSEPTVIRYCRKLGLSGFRALKLRLAEALANPTHNLHRLVSPDDLPLDAVQKVFDSSLEALLRVRAGLNRMPFDAVANAMAGANQWLFLGLGASGRVAEDARHKFFRLGVPSIAATDSPTMLQQAAIARTSDVVIALSGSGQTRDTFEALGIAAARGATTVAIAPSDSPVAKRANYRFGCESAEDTNVFTPTSSRLAQLCVLDGLQVAVALLRGQSASDALAFTKSALSPLRMEQS